ncbi:cytochrome P450 [Ganoderma sinense ZZ0214-1]|uniref:Cytochrome P450 n=1 Tax=Ganoderma sinense ZZ0214-1 TaxID=1077348 RepID=A0A2G8S6L6_9APHY|nr:cytochrome P450 [Ganoderma sinense ZZ0214-1]
METHLSPWVLSLVVYLFLSLANRIRRGSGRRLSGPARLPLFGNALQLPRKRVWMKLADLAKTYGPIYSLQIFRTPVIVINSVEVARELMEAKSANYITRPLTKMVELSGYDNGPVLEPDAGRLRFQRKLLHAALGQGQVQQYEDAQEYHVQTFLRNLAQDPEHYFRHIRHLAAGITIEVSHGYRVRSRDDEFVKEADIFGENFSDAAMPNNYIVDMLPFLAVLPSFLPGMGFKRKAESYKKQYYALADRGHRWVQNEIAKGAARPSLTQIAIAEWKPGQYSEEIIMFSATQVYTGGGDTTTVILAAFLSFMVKHPEILKKAQAEVDRVVGSERLPTVADRPNLPYVEAVFAEVFRLKAPISLLPRLVDQDDVYNGCPIEKGTMVFVNVWGMLHDEDKYPDPHTFKPERWLGGERHPNVYPLDIAFGFGRRVCPGRHIGEDFLFTAVARTIALFNIAPGDESSGGVLVSELGKTFSGRPRQRFSITPRVPNVEELVRYRGE